MFCIKKSTFNKIAIILAVVSTLLYAYTVFYTKPIKSRATTSANNENLGINETNLKYEISPYGEKNIAVIVAHFNNNNFITEFSIPQLTDKYNSVIKNYYLENSFNNITLNTKIFGIYALSMPTTCTDFGQIVANAIKVADPEINYTSVDILVIKLPFNNRCDVYGNHDTYLISTDEGSMEKDIVLLFSEYREVTRVAHEIGHSFGIIHADGWECGKKSIDYLNRCSRGLYGNPFDLMARPEEEVPLPHFSGYFKYYLGWIPETNVWTITKSGKYKIAPIEKQSKDKQLLKIPIPNTQASYYIENRDSIGTDSGLPPEFVKGAIVYIAPFYLDNSTELIDTTPESLIGTRYTDFDDAPLPVGKSFYDHINKIEITTIKDENNYLEVDIKIPNITPVQINKSFSNLNAYLECNKSSFYFKYPEVFFRESAFTIDLSINRDFSSGVYSNFGKGTSSPIEISDPMLHWDQYKVGRKLYWRVKSTDGILSSVKEAIVKDCNRDQAENNANRSLF